MGHMVGRYPTCSLLPMVLFLTSFNSPMPADADDLEQCLRELDADLVGMGGFNLVGTMDAAVRAPRPWWGQWSGHVNMPTLESGNLDCPALSDMLRAFYRLTTPERSFFNNCRYALNKNFNPAKGQIPLFFVLDPLTINDGLQTIQALSTVKDIGRTSLFIMLDGCPPASRQVETCKQGFKELQLQALLQISFMLVEIFTFVPSDTLLKMLPVKASNFSVLGWNSEEDHTPSFEKIRSMHGLRMVLSDRDFPYCVLLSPGSLPAKGFYLYHKAAASIGARAAIIAVSSLPPDDSTAQEHPCDHQRFMLGRSLGAGGSLGLNRKTFLELFTSLAAHEGLGIEASLRLLAAEHAGSRFFLLPSASAPAELLRSEATPAARERAHGAGSEADEACSVFEEAAAREEEELAAACAAQGWAPRLEPRRVFDLTTYFQEDRMLELRMEELGQWVDVFVVIEGDRTFRGHPKTSHLLTRLPRLQRFLHKVRLLQGRLPAHSDLSGGACTQNGTCDAGDAFSAALAGQWTSGYRDWFKREWLTRSMLLRGLYDAGDDDVILMSDVDEIPRGSFVRLLRHCDGIPEAIGFTSRWFQYNASYMKKDSFFRTPNAILRKALGFSDAGFARPRQNRISTKALRCLGFWHLIPWVEDQGWHLSYFGSTSSFAKKIASFSDEVDLDVVTADRIKQLVKDGIDLHTFLDSIRDAESSPRELSKMADLSGMPSFLQRNPELFAFDMDEDDAASGWRGEVEMECKPSMNAQELLSRDFTGITAQECTLLSGVSEDEDKGGLSFTLLSLRGGCEATPRPWPPPPPCFIRSPSSRQTAQRPLVVVSKMEAPPGQTSASTAFLEKCSDSCVWLDWTEGAECEARGYADVVIFWGERMPEPTAIKPMRQLWAYVDLSPTAARSGVPDPFAGYMQDPRTATMFDLVISESTFPEMFSTHVDGCSLCRAARSEIESVCKNTGQAPGVEADAAHVLIMIPQNGHAYAPHDFKIIYRTTHYRFLEDGVAVVELVGKDSLRIAVGAEYQNARKVLSEDPPSQEFRFIIPFLQHGRWELHVALLDASHRVLSADHILFSIS